MRAVLISPLSSFPFLPYPPEVCHLIVNLKPPLFIPSVHHRGLHLGGFPKERRLVLSRILAHRSRHCLPSRPLPPVRAESSPNTIAMSYAHLGPPAVFNGTNDEIGGDSSTSTSCRASGHPG